MNDNTTLEAAIRDVWREANVGDTVAQDSSLRALETFSGLEISNQMDLEVQDSLEDFSPFSDDFYAALSRLVCMAWKPKDASETRQNQLLDYDWKDPLDASLYDVVDSIRITRLVECWMDLNVVGQHGSEQDSESFSTMLLKNAIHLPSEDQGNSLIAALFFHIESLPQLQSQIYFYTQSLVQADRKQQGKALSDPGARLAQYELMQTVTTKLNDQWNEHVKRLEMILGVWYEILAASDRRQCRRLMGSVWSQFLGFSGAGGLRMENTTSSGISLTLKVLLRILKGATEPRKAYEHLLSYHLIPLHRPNAMVLWRDQTSLLELYHEPLVQCIATLLQLEPSWISRVVHGILDNDIWPTSGGNTPKLVLLLHELDIYLGILSPTSEASSPYALKPDSLGDTLNPLFTTLGRCMSSDHSRLAERALAFFKNKTFTSLIELNYDQSLSLLLPFLVRNEPSWNPTVRKMTYNVLLQLQEVDETRFSACCNRIFNEGNAFSASHRRSNKANTQNQPPQHKAVAGNARVIPTPDFSLKASMGTWRPPSGSSAHPRSTRHGMQPPQARVTNRGSAPPLGITGVAPWAKQTGQQGSKSSNPPLGVTGVAPWATARTPIPPKTSGTRLLEGINDEKQVVGIGEEESFGLARVQKYMEKIKPTDTESGSSAWSIAQMAETPTLFPAMKFHDLVFGQELGKGAFGSVKYARMIDRAKTRSHWSEYAVKVISTDIITRMGYESSVQREIAILRVMSHPGVSRLVSSFRFHDGVYLVLEYASGGDLHSLIKKNGSLDNDSTKFVIGEIVAALTSIHEMGFVFGDLKPENVVIMETGHVKLTDFGGCRPVTSKAKDLTKRLSQGVLKNLRDGGWKPSPRNGDTMEESDDDRDLSEDGDDYRVEGTTAYLPPEVVLGAWPDTSADAWALGCVLYQCLSGRPPMLDDDEDATRSRIVSFDSSNTEHHGLFEGSHSMKIREEAKDLISRLLAREPGHRPSMNSVAEHEFFVPLDVFTLYSQKAPDLNVGDAAPVVDAKWARRQFSSIWAPQPKAYDISKQPAQPSTANARLPSPIAEGEEGPGFFSRSTVAGGLVDISEKVPLPPTNAKT